MYATRAAAAARTFGARVEARTSKAEQAEATRGALMRAAHQLFAERGYAGVGTEEIVRRAKVTRGALYHHFADKKDLFRAVHEQLESDLVKAIGAEIAGIEDARELLATGVRSFLDACTDPALAQISLIDAPSVLGWEEWREIDARYGMGLVRSGLDLAMQQGAIPRQDPDPLAHLLLAALGEAALLIASADDPKAARKRVEQPVMALLDGLTG
jgi:AcrR family transcriptional regulator